MLKQPLSFSQWESLCLDLFDRGLGPEDVLWDQYIASRKHLHQLTLFEQLPPRSSQRLELFRQQFSKMPFYEDYKKICQWTLCHRSPAKFRYLYRLFCKASTDPRILLSAEDEDYRALKTLKQQVLKEVHRLQDQVGFHHMNVLGHRVIWTHCEAEHFIVYDCFDFFQRKWQGKNWIILSPHAVIGFLGNGYLRQKGFFQSTKPSAHWLKTFFNKESLSKVTGGVLVETSSPAV